MDGKFQRGCGLVPMTTVLLEPSVTVGEVAGRGAGGAQFGLAGAAGGFGACCSRPEHFTPQLPVVDATVADPATTWSLAPEGVFTLLVAAAGAGTLVIGAPLFRGPPSVAGAGEVQTGSDDAGLGDVPTNTVLLEPSLTAGAGRVVPVG